MEKVVLLVEHSGEHLRCLLNPEQLELKRHSGVVARRSPGGVMSGIDSQDSPLLFSGGGRTELTLDLLFDTALSSREGPDVPPVEDVRALTGPLWDLAENHATDSRYGRPPTVRLLWGTQMNMRGLVGAVSERLERFDSQGRAGRSWLRLRLHRVDDPATSAQADASEPPIELEEARRRVDAQPSKVHDPVGGNGGERIDQIATERLGHPSLWRILAELNGLDDPLRHEGTPMAVPSRPVVPAAGGRE